MSEKICLCVWLSWLILLLMNRSVFALPPLQLYIEITPDGGVLTLPPGRYAGPAVIRRQIKIDGGGKVEIDGGGEGSVISVLADGVEIRGLRIINSGSAHNSEDAGILIEADQTLVENNVLEQVLFGIHLKKANDNIIRGNTISSLDREISLRGDGIRMWYSNGNLLENNRLSRIRDILVSNSAENQIIGNHISQSRIGMEFVFSPDNIVSGNTIIKNDTGVAVIYSDGVNIDDNRIAHMRKLTGSGISFKESGRVRVRGNEIAHSNTGLLANSPLDPENTMTVDNNLFAYNVLGMYFYGEKGGHLIRHNRFENNFTDAMGSAPKTIYNNHWDGNYWDQYRGFDQNQDGVGDQAHDVYLYTDHVWADRPMTRFFRGSMVMTLLDFAFRLAPFSKPEMEYSDAFPLMQDGPE